MEVQRAARGAGVAGGIAFEDGDGVAMTVQDAGEGKSGGTAADHGDTGAHDDPTYGAGPASGHSLVIAASLAGSMTMWMSVIRPSTTVKEMRESGVPSTRQDR